LRVRFVRYANEWSEGAYKRAKSKTSGCPSLEDVLKEWCPIIIVYNVEDIGDMPFEYRRPK
jgi:hypothetical protein